MPARDMYLEDIPLDEALAASGQRSRVWAP